MTLKARRRFKYHGQHVAKGDLLDPEPEGRLRTALVDGGFAEEYHGNLATVPDPVPAPPAPAEAVVPDPPAAEVVPAPEAAKPAATPAKKAPAAKKAASSKKSTAKASKRPPAREPATAR